MTRDFTPYSLLQPTIQLSSQSLGLGSRHPGNPSSSKLVATKRNQPTQPTIQRKERLVGDNLRNLALTNSSTSLPMRKPPLPAGVHVRSDSRDRTHSRSGSREALLHSRSHSREGFHSRSTSRDAAHSREASREAHIRRPRPDTTAGPPPSYS